MMMMMNGWKTHLFDVEVKEEKTKRGLDDKQDFSPLEDGMP